MRQVVIVFVFDVNLNYFNSNFIAFYLFTLKLFKAQSSHLFCATVFPKMSYNKSSEYSERKVVLQEYG